MILGNRQNVLIRVLLRLQNNGVRYVDFSMA